MHDINIYKGNFSIMEPKYPTGTIANFASTWSKVLIFDEYHLKARKLFYIEVTIPVELYQSTTQVAVSEFILCYVIIF